MSFSPLLVAVLLSGVSRANCQTAPGSPGSLRGSTRTEAAALPSATGFINVSNSANESIRVAKSCNESYTLAPGGNAHIDLAVSHVRFWVVPSSVEWDCRSPCSECFYFDSEPTNASQTKITVGYGVGTESSAHSLETGADKSTEVQAELPADMDNLAVVGIDMWNDADSAISSCTADDCVFEPTAFVQNDGVLNLEMWADEAESDDDADTDDADVETAWVGGVARRTTRRVVRRTTRRVVRPFVPVVPGVRGVARRTTRRVVRRTTRRVVR